jgi:hypothetical protein
LTAISVNKGDNVVEVVDVEEDDEDVDPLALKCIWDDDKTIKIVRDDGKQQWWKCLYCKNTFSGHNTTKAVAHVICLTGKDIAVCKSFHFIPQKQQQSHLDLLERHTTTKNRINVTNTALERSIDSHQDLFTSVYNKSRKRSKKGDVSSTASTTALTMSALSVSNPLASAIPNIFMTRRNKEGNKPAALFQLLIGESALTATVTDMIHSSGLPFSLSTDPKF